MLKKLKDILNTYTDNELEELDLWIDSRTKVDSIWVEDYNINLITDEAKVEINNIKLYKYMASLDWSSFILKLLK